MNKETSRNWIKLTPEQFKEMLDWVKNQMELGTKKSFSKLREEWLENMESTDE